MEANMIAYHQLKDAAAFVQKGKELRYHQILRDLKANKFERKCSWVELEEKNTQAA